MAPARRDGSENKDCSGLHDAIFAPVATRQDAIRAGAAAVDDEFPNSFLDGRVFTFNTLRLC